LGKIELTFELGCLGCFFYWTKGEHRKGCALLKEEFDYDESPEVYAEKLGILTLPNCPFLQEGTEVIIKLDDHCWALKGEQKCR